MLPIANALLPIILLILSGLLLKRTRFLPDTFWPAAEKLTYFLLMPALLIHSLAGKKIDALPWRGMLLTVQGTVLISALILSLWWLLNRRAGGALFTSVFQGGVRFNTFAALAIAEALFGTRGLLVAAMGAGFMIPLINLLCISAFSLTVAGGTFSLRRFLLSLAGNPLILGCLIGGTLNLSGVGLAPALDDYLKLSGKAAFPLGLMAVGAAYRLDDLSARWFPMVVSSVVQLVVKPVIAWGLALCFGLSGMAAAVAVLLFSVPTAPSAFILARQLGGDHTTMASIITVQTALSFLSLPIMLTLLA